MLANHNTTAAPGLERFDPDHYRGRRLAPEVAVDTKEMVSTFGHGVHSCPAARFSISAIRISVRGLLDRYELEPLFTTASAPQAADRRGGPGGPTLSGAVPESLRPAAAGGIRGRY